MDIELDAQRRGVLLGFFATCFGGSALAQSNTQILEDLARAALGRAVNSSTNGPSTSGAMRGGAGLSLSDADGGLRQALSNAAVASALRLGKLDGYWADGQVRIPLPSPFGALQSRLRPLRLSTPLDNFQMRLNRAAETAAPRAANIFTDTIRSLTLSDAIAIVRGGDTAGTDMLKARAGAQLTGLMTPPMAAAVESSGAGAALDRISGRYGVEIARLGGLANLGGVANSPAPQASQSEQASAPLIFGAGSPAPAPTNPPAQATTQAPASTSNLRTQLVGFAAQKALDGLFFYVGEEEKAIRRDPAKRTTELLRRVFGV